MGAGYGTCEYRREGGLAHIPTLICYIGSSKYCTR